MELGSYENLSKYKEAIYENKDVKIYQHITEHSKQHQGLYNHGFKTAPGKDTCMEIDEGNKTPGDDLYTDILHYQSSRDYKHKEPITRGKDKENGLDNSGEHPHQNTIPTANISTGKESTNGIVKTCPLWVTVVAVLVTLVVAISVSIGVFLILRKPPQPMHQQGKYSKRLNK